MSSTSLTAVVVGATGLVGGTLVRILSADRRFGTVVALVRRPARLSVERVREQVIDFEQPETFVAAVAGDVLFSALGTTMKAAGSQAAQYRVDHDYQLQMAEAARRNGVSSYVLVSAAGARPGAWIFYSRMKGELERDVERLGFPRTRLLRPGLLDGERSERRPGEQWTLRLLRPIGPLLPAPARPIKAATVARAAIAAALDPTPGLLRWEASDLFRAGA
ncbi:MAG TPA: NAD(P)H-binding protein [Anaeromyxobacter sp.]|nr:NAD(P)H-binding protein [Anaeromyxobacter sp.]